jgi:hypothetical protein
VPNDVAIERYDEDEVWVVSSSPARRDEMLTLDATGSGPPVTLSVRVTECLPVLIDGIVRHRLRLAIEG